MRYFENSGVAFHENFESQSLMFEKFVSKKLLSLCEKEEGKKAKGKLYTGQIGKSFILLALSKKLESANLILNKFGPGLPQNKTTFLITGLNFKIEIFNQEVQT